MLNHKWIIVLLGLLMLTHCKSAKTIATTPDFKLSICNASYKNKPLPFEQPIEEWKALFGQNSRFIKKNAGYKYMWDNQGVFLKKYYDESYPNGFFSPDELYIFFENLEHPVAQAGKFEFARDRETVAHVKEKYAKEGLSLEPDVEKRINFRLTKGKRAPKNYPYPMHSVYKDTLLVDDVKLYRGITLAQYNKQRALVDGAGEIGY